MKRYLLVGFYVAILTTAYNFLVFNVFDFYPDYYSIPKYFGGFYEIVYLVIFVKSFILGIVLMWLFSHGYSRILGDRGDGKGVLRGIFFLTLYAVTAFISFSLGDMVLMGSQEGMLILLTIDGVIETLIATIPIKLFQDYQTK